MINKKKWLHAHGKLMMIKRGAENLFNVRWESNAEVRGYCIYTTNEDLDKAIDIVFESVLEQLYYRCNWYAMKR